jgi:AraC-like DNA-binding protein
MGLQKEFWVKNMVCSRCLKVIKQELEALGVKVISIELGKLKVISEIDYSTETIESIAKVLRTNGFEIVQSEEEKLVEAIKHLLIGRLGVLPIGLKLKTSEYLSQELHRDYKTLSRLFSKNENSTIERYYIRLKVEKAKELVQLGEHSFSDIAYLLDYSSVNHLSRQFKEVVGLNMTDYKNSKNAMRNFYDEII